LLQENGEKYPRWFKKIVNVVNNDITTSPEKVSEEINNLINWYKANKKLIFSLQLAFDFHLKYEQIHPFENGNGRTGRFIMNKILIQSGMLPMIVFTENKQSYFNAIASCKSWNKKKYYKFMLEQYKKTLESIRI
jgi:Fic family protein